MSRVFAYRATAAGIARRQQERRQPIAAIEAVEEERAPTVTPKPSNVIRFRIPPMAGDTRRMPPAKAFNRAKHMEFLATLHIATSTPYSVLIARVAAWHGFTLEQILEPCRKRNRTDARADCVLAVKQAYPKASLPKLGKIFGDRDHTTILHYLRKRGTA